MPENQTKKTIFITSFFGLIARNILATDILANLKKRPDLRIVIVAPKEKADTFIRDFASENVLIEGIDVKPRSRWEGFFFSLFLNALNTDARRITRYYEYKKFNDYFRFFYHGTLARLSSLKLFRKLIRWLDYKLMPKDKFKEVFNKYNPDLLFATDIFEPEDIDFMREARARGVFVLGMVRSWDNITTHGLNRMVPDRLIVNTPYIKGEAIFYDDVEPDKIDVVGIPHYDRYGKEERTSREDLFKKLGLDPAKKTIFFAPPAKLFIKNDPVNSVIIKALEGIEGLQQIIRLYIVGKVDIGDTKPVPGKIAIDSPDIWGGAMSTKLSAKDSHLADLLYHSDIVIAFASSLAIDAVLFGKPVIFIGFDVNPIPAWKSATRFYGFEHQRQLINTGGIKLAKSLDELVNYVKNYLENPNLDKEKRDKILRDRCWKIDGKSSERLTNVIIGALEQIGTKK